MKLPDIITNEAQLEEVLTAPSSALTELMRRLNGDIMILGGSGKMGVSMALLAVNATRAAGVNKKIYVAARFSDSAVRKKLDHGGVETIACDFLDSAAVARLPQVPNVIFMAGRKFGTEGCEELTWAVNILAPAIVAEHYRNSRIVAFSTGCVYPLVDAASGGCTEETAPEPIGEYSQSCLGRERILQYEARRNGTPMLLFRLNYAIDLRYGVLHDIAMPIWRGEKVNNSVSHFNAIWQGNANEAALRALELTATPPALLNVTGPEMVSTMEVAEEFGRLFGKKVEYIHPAPGKLCYLNNASKMHTLFGLPTVSMEQLIRWQAEWIANGGASLNKPTHFEVNNGRF